MSFKIMIQLSIALFAFIFTSLATWYEGSKVLDVPWEWKHTAIFSEIVNGPVKEASDILTIDYFVYAAKFLPTFPLIMFLSGTYLLILIGYIVLKRRNKMFSYFLTSIGLLSLILSGFVSSSPTLGLNVFCLSFLFIGMLSIGVALLRLFNNKTKEIL